MFSNGFHSSMSEFSRIFISHKLELIPLTIAREEDIYKANNIDFYSLMSFKYMLNYAARENIWLISKNGEIIGYISLANIIHHLDNLKSDTVLNNEGGKYYIQLGIERAYQKRQIGTAIVAMVIEIYAARSYPKNPLVYFPIITDINNTIISPTNKICNKLNFYIDKSLNLYARLCKINSPKNNIILNNKLTYFLEYAIDPLIGDKYFIKKPITSFVHLSLGVYQGSEYYYSTGLRYSIDFVHQGSELKNILRNNKNIYLQYYLYDKIKNKDAIIAEAMNNRPLPYFASMDGLIQYCGDGFLSFRSKNNINENNLNIDARGLKEYKFSHIINNYKYVHKLLKNELLLDGKKMNLFSSYI
jgi:GNAT superfamily N-acetyltransferase